MVSRSGLMVDCENCGSWFWIPEDLPLLTPLLCDECATPPDLDDIEDGVSWEEDAEGRWLVELFAPPAVDDAPTDDDYARLYRWNGETMD